MQIATSASCTWSASRSACEYTATVSTPRSLHARITRSAISPRFAIRMRRNTSHPLQAEQRLAELDRSAVLHEDRGDLGRELGLDLVHHLHRLDDAQRAVGGDHVADLQQRLVDGRWISVEGADQRRQEHVA